MKTHKAIWVAFTVWCMGCTVPTKTQQTGTSLSILIDITDTLTLYPSKVTVRDALAIDKDIWQGAEVHISTISDIANTSEQVFTLPPESSLLSSKTVRQSKITAFFDSIDVALTAIKTQVHAPKTRSAVFIKILNSIKGVQKSGASHKQVCVYSDLMELSDVNFYAPGTLALLTKTPEAVTNELLHGDSLPDMKGITIHFLYQPKDYAAGQTFRTVSAYYKTLFEAEGATVHLSGGIEQHPF